MAAADPYAAYTGVYGLPGSGLSAPVEAEVTVSGNGTTAPANRPSQVNGTAVQNLPPVVVTANARFNKDYFNLWQWSVLYHQPAPPVTTSQRELNAYRGKEYAATAPAYQEWLRDSYGPIPQAPQHHGYADIGDEFNQAFVKPVDSAMASLQKLSHDARANAQDWATDPSNTRGAAFGESVDYAVVALGDTLVQGVTGAVRFFTDPEVREGIANAVDHPNEAAAQVVDHVKSMDSEDWATTGFGVMAGGSGVLKKLNTLSKEAALAKTLPKLSEHPVWEDYPAPSEVKAGVDADTLHLNGTPEGTSASTNGVPLRRRISTL